MKLFGLNTSLKEWFDDRRGVSALEFALIAPFAMGVGIFAISAAFSILERQKLDSAVTSTAYYLEDRVLSGDWEAFQPVSFNSNTGETVSGSVLQTARLVLEDAYRSRSSLTVSKLEIFCGCPQTSSETATSFDLSKPFFTRYPVEQAGAKEICSTPCADQTEARILAEIEVSVSDKDMFGSPYVLDKRLVTRLR